MAATKTTTYVIYRHGSNGANQPMTQTMPIGIYCGEGRTATERMQHASDQARDEQTVYNNQWLEAVPASRVSVKDYNAANDHQSVELGLREQYA